MRRRRTAIPAKPPRAAVRSRVADVALTAAAALGALCILSTLAAWLFGIHIVLFSTGSMSPTITAGSAAIAREIDASQIRVGEIVMVDRPGALPVTHRVMSVAEVPGVPDEREIVLRGDANPVDDPAPYQVRRVGLILVWVPGIASAIAALGNPLVIGLLALGAAALVLWAFWPRPGRRPRRSRPPAAGAAGSVVIVGLLATGLALVPQQPAAATTTETVYQGQVIRLTSIADPAQMAALSPGQPVLWQVGVQSSPTATGAIDVELEGTGDPALGLRMRAAWCPVRWVADSCPGGATDLLADAPAPIDAIPHQLLTVPAGQPRWLLLTFVTPAIADPAATASLEVRARGSGDVVTAAPGGTLAATGVPGHSIGTLALVGLGILAIGATIAGRPRRRGRD